MKPISLGIDVILLYPNSKVEPFHDRGNALSQEEAMDHQPSGCKYNGSTYPTKVISSLSASQFRLEWTIFGFHLCQKQVSKGMASDFKFLTCSRHRNIISFMTQKRIRHTYSIVGDSIVSIAQSRLEWMLIHCTLKM
jgi:hypothetical protein